MEILGESISNLSSKEQCQYIHKLIIEGNTRYLAILFSRCSELLDITQAITPFDQTLLHALAISSNKEIIQTFLQKGPAEQINTLIKKQDIKGNNPIHIAVIYYNEARSHPFLGCLSDREYQPNVPPTVDMTQANQESNTPILIAAKNCEKWVLLPQLFKFLKHEEEVLISDKLGNNLLHCMWKAIPSSVEEARRYQQHLKKTTGDVAFMLQNYGDINNPRFHTLINQRNLQGETPGEISYQKAKSLINPDARRRTLPRANTSDLRRRLGEII